MEESERRLASAAHSGIASEELVATRILESPQDFRRWEDEHATLMRRVVVEHGSNAQKIALLSASLALIHRKALFEYLRERHIRGGDRQRVIALFHGSSHYATSIVAEHGNYIRSAASYMCSRHLGRRLMLDPVFGQPLMRYERVYAQYFAAFCDAALARTQDEPRAYARLLLVPLKRDMNELRSALFRLAQSRSSH